MKNSLLIGRKGSVLMISLWILVILVIFAFSLGYRASMSLKLARYQRDMLKADYLGRAGVNKALSVLKEDAADPDTGSYDTKDECGVNLKGKEAKEIFSLTLKDGEGSFNIGYNDSFQDFIYGMRDEESKININQTTPFCKNMVFSLLDSKEIEYPAELADALMDWISPGSQIDIAKKEKLNAPEELMLLLEYFYKEKKGVSQEDAKNMAWEVFSKIRDLFTIYGSGKLNINTASDETVGIFTLAVARNIGENTAFVNGVAGKIIELRNSGPIKKSDDIVVDGLTGAGEINIFNSLKPELIVKSDIFRIDSRGSVKNISKTAAVIYDRQDNKIIYRHEK